MEHGRVGEIYHLSPDRGVQVKRVVELICRELKVPFEEAVAVVPERLGQDKAYTIDSTKARRELGWVPTISFEEGIRMTGAWVSTHFDKLKGLPMEYQHKP
jgi:dTDP-glucose 4,6-dehydratase